MRMQGGSFCLGYRVVNVNENFHLIPNLLLRRRAHSCILRIDDVNIPGYARRHCGVRRFSETWEILRFIHFI